MTTTTTTTRTTMSMNAVEIPCCLCGTMILPNAANQCRTCLAQEVDVRSILQRGPNGAENIILHQCRQCRKFSPKTEFGNSTKKYMPIDLESPEMMALCLKHIPALAPNGSPKFKLVDAMFVWTEPHSMRMKVRLTVQTEIENVRIQQRVVVELVVKFKQCSECNREYTNRTWHAMVQLRQRREQHDAPKKGLAILEMALARNANIRKHVINMDSARNGFDFYFLSLQEAQQFSSYLARMAPMRIKTSNKLVSTDVHSNTANMKYNVSCDMIPLCRDDLIMVHKSAKTVSGRLALVTKVSSVVHLLDAAPKRKGTIEMGDVGPDAYYKAGAEKIYKLVSSPRRLIRFVVLDVELINSNIITITNTNVNTNSTIDETTSVTTSSSLYKGPASGVEKYALADVEVVRECDFGINDESFTCTTHLGNLLQVGDTCLGYDLTTSVVSGMAEDTMEKFFHHHFTMPDIVLVKKVTPKKNKDKNKYEDESIYDVDNYEANNNNNNTNNTINVDNDDDDNDNEENSDDDATDTIASKKQLRKKKKKMSGRAKKRERRRLREEKKVRHLEEAAERMGFISAEDTIPEEAAFERELENDPELAEELLAAEQNLL